MSDKTRERWPKPLHEEVASIADDAPLNEHERAVLRRAAALLRQPEREPDAWAVLTEGGMPLDVMYPDKIRELNPDWEWVPVYFGTLPL